MNFAIHSQFIPNLHETKTGKVIKGAEKPNIYDVGAIKEHIKVCENHIQFH